MVSAPLNPQKGGEKSGSSQARVQKAGGNCGPAKAGFHLRKGIKSLGGAEVPDLF